MKKYVRHIAMGLVLILLVGLLAGCGQDPEDSSAAPTAGDTSAAGEPEPSADSEQTYDPFSDSNVIWGDDNTGYDMVDMPVLPGDCNTKYLDGWLDAANEDDLIAFRLFETVFWTSFDRSQLPLPEDRTEYRTVRTLAEAFVAEKGSGYEEWKALESHMNIVEEEWTQAKERLRQLRINQMTESDEYRILTEDYERACVLLEWWENFQEEEDRLFFEKVRTTFEQRGFIPLYDLDALYEAEEFTLVEGVWKGITIPTHDAFFALAFLGTKAQIEGLKDQMDPECEGYLLFACARNDVFGGT